MHSIRKQVGGFPYSLSAKVTVPALVPNGLVSDLDASCAPWFVVLPVGSWADFQDAIMATGFGIVSPGSDLPEIFRRVRHTLLAASSIHFLILAEARHVTELKKHPSLRQMEMLTIPSEMSAIRRRLVRLWFLAEVTTIERELARSLSPVLRASIRLILRQELPAKGVTRPPLRTLKQVAGRIGVSREYLSRVASESDYPLSNLARKWVALLAIQAHLSDDQEWGAIARRCGYASQSGLANLMKSQLGRIPREVNFEELWFEVAGIRQSVSRSEGLRCYFDHRM